MLGLDRDKFLANDPQTTAACIRLIRSFLRKFISDRAVVADAVQSTMVRLIAKLRETDAVTADDMLRFVSNAASNTLRRRLTQLRRKVVSYQSQLHSCTYSEVEYANFVDQRKEIERIERLLDEHKDRDLLMFVAKVQGYTNEEIARRFGVTKGAVRSSASRTRQRLRIEITAEERRRMLVELASRCTQENDSSLQLGQDSSL